ncbi:MAG: hypothetical protein WD557_12395, partial [Dehalococcoidia bacterium]
SETERVAIEAGNVWIEGDLCSGKPDFDKIFEEPYPELTDKESLMGREFDIPLDVVACDLTVFEPGEGLRHAELLQSVRGATRGREELADGWRFALDGSAFAWAAEWIGYERRCCGFFDFRLEWLSGQEPVLTVTGPPGAKEMLAGW